MTKAPVEVIRRYGRRYLLERPQDDTITDGYAVKNAPKKLNIFAHAQPLSPKELRNLAPGQNASDWRNLWSIDEVFLRDRIHIDGKIFTLQTEATWSEGGFWHATVSRVIDRL